VTGRVGGKPVGTFTYDKALDDAGVQATCEVRVYPLLVRRQLEVFPESEQRMLQWVEPGRAVLMIKDPGLRKLVKAFAKRLSVAASNASP
jgi:hypothetical protein